MASDTSSAQPENPEISKAEAALKAGKQTWLRSSSKWNDTYFRDTTRPHTKWTGDRILSRKKSAIVGSWKLQEYNPGFMTSTSVVVKQKPLHAGILSNEGKFLSELHGCSEHIVRVLHQPATRAVGLGSFDDCKGWEHLDARPEGEGEKTVERLFLEPCQGGNLTQFMERDILYVWDLLSGVYTERLLMMNTSPKYPFSKLHPEKAAKMPEIIFWKVFECLARGICALEFGNESFEYAAYPAIDRDFCFVHTNITPDNILVGSRIDKHSEIPILKIGGFGQCIDNKSSQTEAQREVLKQGNNKQFMPPEIQKGQPLSHSTNVWQIAKCASMLITKGKDYPTYGDDESLLITHVDHARLFNSRFKTYGPDLRSEIEWREEIEMKTEDLPTDPLKFSSFVPDSARKTKKRIYSKDVDSILYPCLAVDPRTRPQPRVLLMEICKVLEKLKVPNEDEVLETAEKRKEEQEKQEAAALEKQKEKEREEQREKRRKEEEERIKKEQKRQKEWEERERDKTQVHQPRDREPDSFKRRRLVRTRKLRVYRVDT